MSLQRLTTKIDYPDGEDAQAGLSIYYRAPTYEEKTQAEGILEALRTITVPDLSTGIAADTMARFNQAQEAISQGSKEAAELLDSLVTKAVEYRNGDQSPIPEDEWRRDLKETGFHWHDGAPALLRRVCFRRRWQADSDSG